MTETKKIIYLERIFQELDEVIENIAEVAYRWIYFIQNTILWSG